MRADYPMTDKEELILIHARMRRLLEAMQAKVEPHQKALFSDVLRDSERFGPLLDKVTKHRAIRLRRAPVIPTLTPKPWYKFW